MSRWIIFSKWVDFFLKFRDLKENMAPESHTQGGALSQGAKSLGFLSLLDLACFPKRGNGCPFEKELLLAAVPDDDHMDQSPVFGIR